MRVALALGLLAACGAPLPALDPGSYSVTLTPEANTDPVVASSPQVVTWSLTHDGGRRYQLASGSTVLHGLDHGDAVQFMLLSVEDSTCGVDALLGAELTRAPQGFSGTAVASYLICSDDSITIYDVEGRLL